jgi:ATP dependent DNA ligase domain
LSAADHQLARPKIANNKAALSLAGVRKSDGRVRLYSRPGNDFTHRFPLIVEALARLRSRSCIIDGEAVACDDNGVASFDLVGTTALTAACFYTPST